MSEVSEWSDSQRGLVTVRNSSPSVVLTELSDSSPCFSFVDSLYLQQSIVDDYSRCYLCREFNTYLVALL